MREERRKKHSPFELGILALTVVILALMAGRFVFGAVRPSDTWRVEVERNDSPEGSAPGREQERPESLLEGEMIDLNTAGAADLERLPGLGSIRAQAVVEYRQEHGDFHSVDDLLSVDGIGSGILEQVRPYVTVG